MGTAIIIIYDLKYYVLVYFLLQVHFCSFENMKSVWNKYFVHVPIVDSMQRCKDQLWTKSILKQKMNFSTNSSVQLILCCVFVLFSSSLLPVSLDFPFLIVPSVFSTGLSEAVNRKIIGNTITKKKGQTIVYTTLH